MTALGRVGVAILVAVACVVAVIACGPSATERLDEQWSELGVQEAEFVFLGDITAQERESIRRELRVAQVVYEEHFGAITSEFTVYVGADLDLLNERLAADRLPPASFTCHGGAVRGAIVIAIKDCREEVREIGANLAEVYFFILQWQAGTTSYAEGSLRWFPRASAAYAAALVDDARGRRPLDVRRRGEQLRWSSLGQPFLGDASIDQVDHELHLSGVGFLATEWLVERAGTQAVLRVFSLGGHRAAFESAFGMSVDAFHDAFERHRSQVAPPFVHRAAGKVVGTDGVAIEGASVYVVVRIEGEAWPAGSGTTDTHGAFELDAPGSGYTIAVWFRCPDVDGRGRERRVHVGEWGADGFLADMDGYLEDDQKGPEPFADGERDRTELVVEIPETRESLIAKGCEE